MEGVNSGGEGRQSSPVVYVGGTVVSRGPAISDGYRKLVWYRLDVDSLLPRRESKRKNNNKKKKTVFFVKPSAHKRRSMALLQEKTKEIPRVKLSNTAVEVKYGSSGCCTMIGNHIYWFGVNRRNHRDGDSSRRDIDTRRDINYTRGDISYTPCSHSMDLFKHNINDRNPLSWDTLSKTRDLFSLGSPVVVAPVGRKIYVLRGTGTGPGIDEARDRLNHWGAIYDLDSNTWEILICNISTPVGSYSSPHVVLVEREDGEPEGFLFYSLREGSLLFFDLTSGEWRQDQAHDSLALWNPFGTALDLEDDGGASDALIQATKNGPAIFSDRTLYWFTSNLLLYGYNIDLKRWFRSPFLGKQFPTLQPFNRLNRDLCPFLVDLRNGEFMLLVAEGRGELTVARLSVSRDYVDSLSVTVESVCPLSHGHTFDPIPEMSMLKSTRCDSMHGPVEGGPNAAEAWGFFNMQDF